MKTNTVTFVYFDQLDGSEKFLNNHVTFDGFSYGDSAMTLVTPGKLLEEVEPSEYPTLYKSLMDLDKDMLVGFDC